MEKRGEWEGFSDHFLIMMSRRYIFHQQRLNTVSSSSAQPLVHYRGFAQRGMNLYMHDFAMSLGFLLYSVV